MFTPTHRPYLTLSSVLAMILAFLLCPQPAPADEVRLPLTIHNNTGATLTITLMTAHELNRAYGAYTVPPGSHTLPAALRLGYTRFITEARRCGGVPHLDKTMYHGSSTHGLGLEYFPRDFGVSVMSDAPQPMTSSDDPACDLSGEWQSTLHGGAEGIAHWQFDPKGRGTYDARETGFGGASGTATLKGRTLVIAFSFGGNKTGTYTLQLTEDCRTASGSWDNTVPASGTAEFIRAAPPAR